MNIGFVGYNRRQTNKNFIDFLNINDNIVKITYSPSGCKALLKDGDTIWCISPDDPDLYTKRFDYLILSDDSRMMILEKDLSNVRFTDTIPEDFRIMIDNIDEVINEEIGDYDFMQSYTFNRLQK